MNALKKWFNQYGMGSFFVLPFLVLFIVFTLLPVLIGVILSFTRYDFLGSPEFIGLENYKNLLIRDGNFALALKNTFIIGGIAGPVGYLMSFLFAWIINNMHFKRLFIIIFYAPSITGGMTVIWDYLFSGDRYGLINNFLLNLGVINQPIIFNQNSEYIIPVNLLIIIWGSMGTGFLVFVAGLQNNDAQMLEAARIDGIRNSFQELWYIILPQMKPQLLYGAINSIVGAVGISPAFGGFPSPNYVAHTLSHHIQDHGFLRFEMGYASAICTIMFLISFILGRVVMVLLTDRPRKRPKRIKWGISK